MGALPAWHTEVLLVGTGLRTGVCEPCIAQEPTNLLLTAGF